MRILVTGGAGFIGSCLVRSLVDRGRDDVVVLDALTYAGNLENLAGLSDPSNSHLIYPDDQEQVGGEDGRRASCSRPSR